jgi:hypothetical protein
VSPLLALPSLAVRVCFLAAPDVVRALVSRGADVHATTRRYREMPLHTVPSGSAVQALLECGADANTLDSKGRSPLQALCGPGARSQVFSRGAALLKWPCTDLGPFTGPAGAALREQLPRYQSRTATLLAMIDAEVGVGSVWVRVEPESGQADGAGRGVE